MTILQLPIPTPPIPDCERDLRHQITVLETKIRVLQDQRDHLIQRVLAIRAGSA